MPQRSPSARSSAWPSTSPVSSTVWWAAGLEVTLDRRGDRGGRGGQQMERVIEEPDAGGHSPAPLPEEAERQQRYWSPPDAVIEAVRVMSEDSDAGRRHRDGVGGEALRARRSHAGAPAGRPGLGPAGPRPSAAGVAHGEAGGETRGTLGRRRVVEPAMWSRYAVPRGAAHELAAPARRAAPAPRRRPPPAAGAPAQRLREGQRGLHVVFDEHGSAGHASSPMEDRPAKSLTATRQRSPSQCSAWAARSSAQCLDVGAVRKRSP